MTIGGDFCSKTLQIFECKWPKIQNIAVFWRFFQKLSPENVEILSRALFEPNMGVLCV
jgi:hypothetical protein